MLRMHLFAFIASAAAFQVPTVLPQSKLAVARVAPVVMEEPSDRAIAIGAAGVGAVVGVYLFHDLYTSILCAAAFSYGSTTAGRWGRFTKSAGTLGAKAYSKSSEINDQYEVVPKAKSALDVITTAASNIDENYGFTASLDEKLKLSEAIDKAGDKYNEVKDNLSSKVDEIKNAKA